MPGIRPVVRETTYSRGFDQICNPEAHVLSPEEQAAAEESLSAYCKPIELDNIIHRHLIKKPLFLQRCLYYKIEAKRKRRLRIGNVIFNYRYYHNSMQKTEVSKDFRCPFCLVKGSSFKGLKCHLTSSHDLFRYEFWANEDYQVVNVFLKASACSPEIVADKDDPRQQTFFICFNRLRRWKPESSTQNANTVHPLLLNSERMEYGTFSASAGVSSTAGCSFSDSGSAQPGLGNNPGPSSALPFAKTRKLSVEQSEPRSQALLKHQFFHSKTAQPMEPEQVLANEDSEDEVDDVVADLEDQRRLDEFVDVSKDEKQIMHLWNSFVRKQRVLADGHIPWACEAFSKLHGQGLVRNPSLHWRWRTFMTKLYDQGLLDPLTVDKCSNILERFRQQWQNNDPPTGS